MAHEREILAVGQPAALVDARPDWRGTVWSSALPMARRLLPIVGSEMTGCRNAIAMRDRYLEVEARCPELAYGLHRVGGKCRRLGGPRQCADCLKDLRPEEVARLTALEV